MAQIKENEMKKIFVIIFLFYSCNTLNRENELSISVQTLIDSSSIPAVVVGKVVKKGTATFYSKGPATWKSDDNIDENSIFRIASMTKALTSVSAMQLVERGIISLDEPLDSLLPEMSKIPILDEDKKLIEPTKSITLRHLLTHTAGFGYWFTSNRIRDWDSIREQLNINDWDYKDEPRLFESGSEYMYGTNTGWVGKLVEKLSGLNLEDYFRKNISKPLGMNSTWFNVPEELHHLIVASSTRDKATGELTKNPQNVPKERKSFNGGGGLFSSPSDYSKFLICMLNRGTYDDIEILKPETFDLMNTPQLEDFKQQHRYVSVGNVDNASRGDKDSFFDNYDNWTLAWGYEENSKIRPLGTSYWAGFYNTYFTIDYQNEFALFHFTQILPFNDKESYNLFTDFERLVYKNK